MQLLKLVAAVILVKLELLVKVNYTFTNSEIVIGEGDTFVNLVGVTELASSLLANGRDDRLQGQSDNILNFQIGFNDFIANSQGTLIFNYVDDRVRARGKVEGVTDMYCWIRTDWGRFTCLKSKCIGVYYATKPQAQNYPVDFKRMTQMHGLENLLVQKQF